MDDSRGALEFSDIARAVAGLQQQCDFVLQIPNTNLAIIMPSHIMQRVLMPHGKAIIALLRVGFLGLSLHPSICCVAQCKRKRFTMLIQVSRNGKQQLEVWFDSTDLFQLCHQYYKRREGLHNPDESFDRFAPFPEELLSPTGDLPCLILELT